MNAAETLLIDLLNIESPTYNEQRITEYLKEWCESSLTPARITHDHDGLIVELTQRPGLDHIALIGHTDVVPSFKKATTLDGLIYGAGASDMKGGLASMLAATKASRSDLSAFNVSIVLYSREEGTAIKDNGLYDLIQSYPDFFKSIDLAIVTEPTNNTIQLGCVGSMHATVTFNGEHAHSARPWDGKNALYEAADFIQAIKQVAPVRHDTHGVQFFDVIQITESESERGKTTLPSWWKANVNFRFAPVWTEADANAYFIKQLIDAGASKDNIEITSSVYAGDVVMTDTLTRAIDILDRPVEAKQAWTDVAQLAKLGIPAMNFGPGLTSQAHKETEHIRKADLIAHCDALIRLLGGI